MKNGYFVGMIAGLIAGVISGITANLALILACILRLPWPILPISSILTIPFLTTHFGFEIVINGTLGAILGIIYSIYYDATPGKGILKGLFFGLILYLIGGAYFGFTTFVWVAGELGTIYAIANWWMIFFTLVPYGLILGALYKKPIHTKGEYDIKGGIIPGTVAGIVGGIAATIFTIVGVNLRVWDPERVLLGLLSASSFTTHHIFTIAVTIAFGAIFGSIYSMYYDSTPSKGIIKGLLFGLILYFISDVRMGVINAGYGFSNEAIANFWIGFFTFVAYGLILGYLYKPSK